MLKCGLPEAVWGGVVPALVHALCVCEGVRSALFYMCACVAALSWFCVCFSLVNLFPLIRATFHAVKKGKSPLCVRVCVYVYNHICSVAFFCFSGQMCSAAILLLSAYTSTGCIDVAEA